MTAKNFILCYNMLRLGQHLPFVSSGVLVNTQLLYRDLATPLERLSIWPINLYQRKPKMSLRY